MTERTDQEYPNGTQTRFTVPEAARTLGISAEAVRSRVQRQTLKSTKANGTVYVLLDADQTRPDGDESTAQTDARTHPNDVQTGDQTQFIASLQDQIEWLRREVERKDTIIMTITQRIPELEPAREASPEPRESPVSASEERDGGGVPPEQEKRSWWRRFFGVE
jgi:uncharacterized coiled-coil protein SlyX